MPWWAHWYVMIPAVLALWGLGVLLARSNHQRYQRKLASGRIKPPKPKPLPCENGCELSSYENRDPCLMGCRKRVGRY
jgi:hypothetical protein